MIEQLRSLGLTEYESRAYIALLKYGVLGGKEASRHSLVPYSAVHFVLQQLAQKNFAVVVSRKPMRFRAIKPEIALNAWIKEKNSELVELKESAISEFAKLERSSIDEEEEKVEISAGKEQRFANAVELTNSAKKEKLIISMTDVQPVELLKADAAAIRRGAKGRLITTVADENNEDLLRQFRKIGFKVRYYAPLFGFSLVVYDRKVSLIIIIDKKTKKSLYNLKLDSKELAEAFAEYFDYVWNKAKPV